MKTNILIPALFFLFISFSAVAQDHHQTEPKREHSLEHRKERLAEFKSQLDLSDEQVVQLKALMHEKHQKMQALRADKPSSSMSEAEKKEARLALMKRRKNIQDDHQQKMKELLSPEQYETYLSLKEENHSMGKRHKHHKHEEMDMHPTKDGEHRHHHKKGEHHEH